MRRVLGIDPGARGGLALIDAAGVVCALRAMPSSPETGIRALELHQWLDDLDGRIDDQPVVYLEEAQPYSGEGVRSVFSYGRGFGRIEAVLAIAELEVIRVRPNIWTKVLHADTPPGDAKARTLLAVERLHPEANLLATPRCRVPHSGLVDAIGIAHYGWLKERER